MTFLITLYVREGIVMASDSRLTLNVSREEDGKGISQFAVGESDSINKTFLAPGNIGISTFGRADVQGVPISGFIESFIDEHLANKEFSVSQVPLEILNYFKNLPESPDAGFIIAGYQKNSSNISEQHVWEAMIKTGEFRRVNKPGIQGAVWEGEDDILKRLIYPLWEKSDSNDFVQLPYFQIQWGFFTLQDAIDFALYAVRTTIDTMHFHPRPKTVGGPIDVLVIKPLEAFWIAQKKLHM
jgi:hypothetical protein